MVLTQGNGAASAHDDDLSDRRAIEVARHVWPLPSRCHMHGRFLFGCRLCESPITENFTDGTEGNFVAKHDDILSLRHQARRRKFDDNGQVSDFPDHAKPFAIGDVFHSLADGEPQRKSLISCSGVFPGGLLQFSALLKMVCTTRHGVYRRSKGIKLRSY